MIFSPLKILERPYSVILLNHNGHLEDEGAVIRIWNNATSRIAIDGGTNLWYNLYKSSKSTVKVPHFVSGDFDSILPEVLAYVKSQTNSIKVIPTPDQDDTDFTKGLQIILNDEQSPKDILALATNRMGRFDQLMSNLNTLIRSKSAGLEGDLVLYDHQNVIFPLAATNTMQEIELKSSMTCGIIPICGDTHIKSKGLKWELDDIYAFGKVISSSNKTTKNVIQIQSSLPIIFSASCSLF